MKTELEVDRPHAEAAQLFAGPVSYWLPAIVGPDENSWRAETQEGPAHLRVEVEAGPVFVHPDRTSWRRLSVQPDRTSLRSLVTAAFTPSVEGQLGLTPRSDGSRCLLRFEGRSSRRSTFTGWLERLVVGDPLARSGMRTLLHEIAECLATGSVEEAEGDEPRFGNVICRVERGQSG